MCVDLHLHSLYSDGSATPQELTEMAARNKLAGIALTDHDTVEGIAEFLAHGGNLGLAVIPGLEVSAAHRNLCFHILGYGIDHASTELRQWLEPLQKSRQERNEKIIDKMRQMGLDVHMDELRTISSCGQTGRPHIARLLLNKGIVDSMGQAFHQFLRRGAPAWFSRLAYDASECIAMIHRAGGLAVLAHPGQFDPDLKILPLLIPELVQRGLDGLEVHYPSHPAELRRRLLALARKYNLVVTGGSDYHGKNKNMSVMAGGGSDFCPPDSILAALAERIDLRASGAKIRRTDGGAG